MALQVDGKIVVAGETGTGLAVVRYQADGSLDPSFDGNGILVSSSTETLQFVAGMAIQPDGQIVIAGSRGVASTSGPPSQDWVVVRYDPTGTLDTTFGVGGIVVTDFAGLFDTANAIALRLRPRSLAGKGTGSHASTEIDIVDPY